MTNREKEIMSCTKDECKITLAEFLNIFWRNKNDELIIYDNEDYEILKYNEDRELNEVVGYECGLFSINTGMLKIASYLNPKYALAEVMYCEHNEDGKFRVVIMPWKDAN